MCHVQRTLEGAELGAPCAQCPECSEITFSPGGASQRELCPEPIHPVPCCGCAPAVSGDVTVQWLRSAGQAAVAFKLMDVLID